MKKVLLILLILAFSFTSHAWDYRDSIKAVIADKNSGGGGTTYLFENFDSWSDLTGFTSSDQNPANQMLFDTTSKCSGANSIRHDAQDGGGGTSGLLPFTETTFYAAIEIYIDSSGSSPTNSDGVLVFGVGPSAGTQGAGIVLYYDTDHFECNATYRDDAGVLNYVIGSSGLQGITISANTKHTLHLYYKGGSGADGEVWFALDSGAFTKKTGLDLNTKTSAFVSLWVSLIDISGSHSAGEWDCYTDTIWMTDYDTGSR